MVSTPTSRLIDLGVGDGGDLLLVNARRDGVAATVVSAHTTVEHAEALGTGMGGAEVGERQQ